MTAVAANSWRRSEREGAMKPWKTLEKETVFDASPYVSVSRQVVELPDGALIDDFYQVDLRPFVVVVPVLPDGRILVIWQYKHGLGRASLTFPAGFVEAGEAPDDAIQRELMEETGYAAGAISHLGEFVDNGNQRGCTGNYYVATGCVQRGQPNSGDLEEMEVKTVHPGEIDGALASGDIGIIHHAAVWTMAKARGLVPESAR